MSREIKIEHNIDERRLDELGVNDWPIWTEGCSTFPWSYDDAETCYFLEGQVVVTPEGGEPVEMGVGELVTFPSGMSCTWEIRRAVRKHYNFG